MDSGSLEPRACSMFDNDGQEVILAERGRVKLTGDRNIQRRRPCLSLYCPCPARWIGTGEGTRPRSRPGPQKAAGSLNSLPRMNF